MFNLKLKDMRLFTKKLDITPDFILHNLAELVDLEDDMVYITATYDNHDEAWVELALNTLRIKYETYDHDDENDKPFLYGFNYKKIKRQCPLFHRDIMQTFFRDIRIY